MSIWRIAFPVLVFGGLLTLIDLAPPAEAAGSPIAGQPTDQTSAIPNASVKLPNNLIRLPMSRQATDYTCGVAALQSVLAYFGDEHREDALAKELKSGPQHGTAYQEIIRVAKKKGFAVQVFTDMTTEELKKLIDQGKPVICLIQAWPERKVDYVNDWDDGHYVVAIGHDENNFYFMDPSTLGNYTFIPVREFLDRWHDTDSKEKLVHFGMVVEKVKPKYNPDACLKME